MNEKSEINALKQLLARSDYKAIKHSEGKISDVDYQKIREQRHSWRLRILELESKLAELDAADNSAAE